jgi:hypothetical protein
VTEGPKKALPWVRERKHPKNLPRIRPRNNMLENACPSMIFNQSKNLKNSQKFKDWLAFPTLKGTFFW